MSGKIVGYARVSSYGQSLVIQVDKLKKYGCNKIYKKISGCTQNRTAFINDLDYLREDDTLVITKLDRMARSVFHLGQITKTLDNKGVNFIVMDQNIDTEISQGKLMFHMLASFAEFENDLKKERQLEGIYKGMEKGVKFGRPSKITPQIKKGVLQDIKTSDLRVREIFSKYNISRNAYYTIKNDSVT